MGKLVQLTTKQNETDVIQISKNKIIITAVEYENMDFECFIDSTNMTEETRDPIIRGLLEGVKEECKIN